MHTTLEKFWRKAKDMGKCRKANPLVSLSDLKIYWQIHSKSMVSTSYFCSKEKIHQELKAFSHKCELDKTLR